MNDQVYQQHNQRNDQEQGGDAQPVSQAEPYDPDDDQHSEERLQHRCASPASVTSGDVVLSRMMTIRREKSWSIWNTREGPLLRLGPVLF